MERLYPFTSHFFIFLIYLKQGTSFSPQLCGDVIDKALLFKSSLRGKDLLKEIVLLLFPDLEESLSSKYVLLDGCKIALTGKDGRGN